MGPYSVGICLLAAPPPGDDQLCDLNGHLVWNPSGILNLWLLSTPQTGTPPPNGTIFVYDQSADTLLPVPGATFSKSSGVLTDPALVIPVPSDTTHTNAYVVCPSGVPAPQSLTSGQTIYFSASNANLAASTLNWCASGVKSITKNGGVALLAGDIPVAPYPVQLTWDGTEWSENNPVASSGSGTISSGTSTHFGIYTG